MRKLPAYTVYLLFEGSLSLFYAMIFTYSSVYQVTMVGLSPLQLVLVGTLLEFTVFVFEVPTGVVADVYSRRLSTIIGVFMIGVAFILEGAVPLFFAVMLAQIIWGIGYTFTSGATEAWITDEIGEGAAGRAFLRASQVGQVTAFAGIGLGIFLANVRVNIPIIFGGICFLFLGWFLILFMPEHGYKPVRESDRSSWENMRGTFRDGLNTVRKRPTLYLILGIGLFYGLYSEAFDRLWVKYIIDNYTLPAFGSLDPVTWFGVIRGIGLALSIAATEFTRRRVRTENSVSIARALQLVTIVLVGSLFTFALAGRLALVLIAFWMVTVARQVIAPLYTAWVNQYVESRVRATVLSMSSQVDAIGQMIAGPVMGLVGSLVSVQAAIISSGVLLAPVLGLYSGAIRRESRHEQPAGGNE